AAPAEVAEMPSVFHSPAVPRLHSSLAMGNKWYWGALFSLTASFAEIAPADAQTATCSLAAPVVVATSPTVLDQALEVDDRFVYYDSADLEDGSSGDLWRTDDDGGGTPELLARRKSSALNNFQFAANATGVYFLDAGLADTPALSGGVW